MSLNRASIIGHLGQSPALRNTKTGKTFCTFSVATNEYAGTEDGKPKERTEWHSVVVFGNQAMACSQYLRKGSRVYVEGSLSTNQFKGSDGLERRNTTIVSQSVQFLDSKERSTPSVSTPTTDEGSAIDLSIFDEDFIS